MADNELERIYTIPLRIVKQGSRNKAANRAVREVKSYLTRHMKSGDIWIDAAVNQALWAHGMYKIPSKIRIRAVKFEDGVVEVSLPEEETSGSIRETLRQERESKAPILPTPALEEGEAPAGEAGTAEIEAEPEPEEKAPAEAEVTKPSAPSTEVKKTGDEA